MYNYGFKFLYREKEGDEQKFDYFFFSLDTDNQEKAFDHAEVLMLKFLKKHDYFSGKVIKVVKC